MSNYYSFSSYVNVKAFLNEYSVTFFIERFFVTRSLLLDDKIVLEQMMAIL